MHDDGYMINTEQNDLPNPGGLFPDISTQPLIQKWPAPGFWDWCANQRLDVLHVNYLSARRAGSFDDYLEALFIGKVA